MKRLGLGLFIGLVLLTSCALAGCRVANDTVMWLDAHRFSAIDRVISAAGPNSKQAKVMIASDLYEGSAILVSKGTAITILTKFNKYISIISISGTPLIALNQDLACE